MCNSCMTYILKYPFLFVILALIAGCEGKKPDAIVNDINIEHGMHEDGKNGMIIHVDFKVLGHKDDLCNLTLWFYSTNAKESNKLYSRDGDFQTTDGQVAIRRFFKPGYENSVYSDYKVFMPYEELHVSYHEVNHLKFKLGFFYEDESTDDKTRIFTGGKTTKEFKYGINLRKQAKPNESKSTYGQPQRSKCSTCNGSGQCIGCAGTGKLICKRHDTNGDGNCTECKNTGFIRCFMCYNYGTGLCDDCKGTRYN